MIATLLLAAFNDGSMHQTATALNFAKNKDIQMVREVVKIVLNNDSAALVTVDFTFKNHGKAQTATMGFPEEAAGDWSKPSLGFRSWVDGKEVKVEKRELPTEDFEYKAVHVKTVTFRAGQTRKVKVSYQQELSGNTSGANWLRYIITTGATWSGKIESMKISVDARKLPSSDDVRLILAKEATLSERIAAARFATSWKTVAKGLYETEIKNVKPDFNLVAYALPGFWRFEVDGWPTPVEYGINSAGPSWPMVEGEDVLVPVGLLGSVFAAETVEGLGRWSRLGSAHSNADWEVTGPSELKVGDKVVKLRRPLLERKDPRTEFETEWVYLRDFIEAFGGTYRFDKTRRVAVMTSRK